MARRVGNKRTFYLALCIVVATTAATSSASDGRWRIDKDNLVPEVLASADWRVLFRKDVAPTRFRPQGDGGIAIETEDSVAFLYRRARGQERQASQLTWRWTVVENLPPTDLRVPGVDDRPAALHLWFDRPAKETGVWRRLKDGFAALADFPLAGKTLTYVWGGAHERGERFPSPYEKEDGAVVVLRPGDTPLREWYSEKVDFATDFELAFGYPAPPVRYVALSADSEDAGGSSRAVIADLTFETAGM